MADVVIVGAGIAGVSAAYHLAVKRDPGEVVIVDPRPPLTLTSDKSTECFRNWWPSKSMVGLMNRSIDLIEQLSDSSGDSIGFSRRGYIYATADGENLDQMIEGARSISTYGAGEVRLHDAVGGYDPEPPGPPDGVDILVGEDVVQAYHPWLAPETVGLIHARKAGWYSAQQAGSFMLDAAKEAGVRHVVDEVVRIEVEDGRVTGVRLASGDSIPAAAVVNAAGPFADRVAAMVDVELPVFNEVHVKVTFRDHLGVVPRNLGMFIWNDEQSLDWTPEEREALLEEGREDLLGKMPFSCHGRPEGGTDSPYFVGLWEYDEVIREPEWPLPDDPLYPEVVMRGLSTMMPGLSAYLDGLPQSSVDGGYYTKTRENRPLIGPAGPDGFYLVCAFGGFGVMASAGAADLIAGYLTGEALPSYSPSFALSRYDDPEYLAEIASVSKDSGQL